MNDKNGNEKEFDQLIESVRNLEPTQEMLDESRKKVWGSLVAEMQSSRLDTCDDFRKLMPEYRAGNLSGSKLLLFEDHIHSCVPCRKLLYNEQQAPTPISIDRNKIDRNKPKTYWSRYAVAATLLLCVGWATWRMMSTFGTGGSGQGATVQAVNGQVYRLRNGALQPLTAGAVIEQGELVRTAGGSGAVLKIADGSAVELSERAELSLQNDSKDSTIRLVRGSVIVQASKRSSGHLYVSSPDCRVAVTGTVFSVNRGVKGSRVSVLEGEVHVEHGSKKSVLHAGDQVATAESLDKVSIEEEIAWSRNREEHLELLKQFSELKQKLETIDLPSPRHNSSVLEILPADTAIFASLPNAGNAVEQAQRLFDQQLGTSDVLRRWWSSSMSKQGVGTALAAFTKISGYLGEEIAFALVPSGSQSQPVAIASVTRPGLAAVLRSELAKLEGTDRPRVYDDGEPLPTSGSAEFVAIRGQRVFVTSSAALVNSLLQPSATATLKNTDFGRRISNAFTSGTGILVALDLHKQSAAAQQAQSREATALGMNQVRYLIVEQKQVAKESQQSVEISFDGKRAGAVSWLGSPSTIGGLSFLSPDAKFAAAAVFKKPEGMLDDLLKMDMGVAKALEEIHAAAGIDVRADIASALGGELTIAMDGPMGPPLPWRIIAEVNNPGKLQAGLERALNSAREAADPADRARYQILAEKRDDAPGGVFYTLQFPPRFTVQEVHYAYVDGYLVMAPSRALVSFSADNRKAGVWLTSSQTFQNLLPRDRHTSFSGVVYHNAGDMLRMMSGLMGAQAAGDLIGGTGPMLVSIYATDDRIEIVNKGSVINLLMPTIIGTFMKDGRTQSATGSYRIKDGRN